MSSEHHFQASDVIAFRYIHVAIASAWLWDALVSFSTEVDAFVGRTTGYAGFAYVSSRVLTLAIVICEIVVAVTPLGPKRCNILIHMLSAFGTTTTCLGTFLFLIRVRGAFFHSKLARRVYSVWWFLAVVAMMSTTPFSFSGESIEDSDLCAVSRAAKIEAVGCFTVAAFDCAVFVSISFRVISFNGSPMSGWARAKAFITGSKAGPIAKALLQTGQLYYFPMSTLLVCLLTFEFSSFLPPRVSPQCQATTYLAIAVSYNMMACRVFRLLRLVVANLEATVTTEMGTSNLCFRQYHARGEESTYDETLSTQL